MAGNLCFYSNSFTLADRQQYSGTGGVGGGGTKGTCPTYSVPLQNL